MMIGKAVYTIIIAIVFGSITFVHERNKIEIMKQIKPSRGDKFIKCRVVMHIPSGISTDIRPVLAYTYKGQYQLYEFFTLKRRREYPIGKVFELRISQKSGYAYDLKDFIKGIIYSVFLVGWWSFGLLIGILYLVKHI